MSLPKILRAPARLFRKENISFLIVRRYDIGLYTSRLVPLSPKSSSDGGIHEELRELLKNSRETYSDFSIFGNKPSICIQKVAFGEMELVQKTTDGHPKSGGVRNDNLRYLSVKPNASISVLRQKIWHLLDLPDFCEEVIVLKSNDVEIPLTEVRKGNDPQKPFILEVWPPNNLQTFKPNMLTMGSQGRPSATTSIIESEQKSQAGSRQDLKDIESIEAVPAPTKEGNQLRQKCPMNTLPPEYKNSELSCKISTSSLFFKLPGRRTNRDNFAFILLKIQDDLLALSDKLSTLEDKIRT